MVDYSLREIERAFMRTNNINQSLNPTVFSSCGKAPNRSYLETENNSKLEEVETST